MWKTIEPPKRGGGGRTRVVGLRLYRAKSRAKISFGQAVIGPLSLKPHDRKSTSPTRQVEVLYDDEAQEIGIRCCVNGARGFNPIKGNVPDLLDLPSGCPFADRCPAVMDKCRTALPPLFLVGEGHTARCVLYDTAPIAPESGGAPGRAHHVG